MADPHDELARLLEHARDDAPSAQLFRGVRERVLSATAVPPPPIESMSVPRAVAPVSTGAASSLLKLGLGALILGLIAAGYIAQRPSPAPAPASVLPPVSVPVPVPLPDSPPTLSPAPPIEAPVTEPPALQPKPKPHRAIRPPQSEPAPVVQPAPLPVPTSSFAEEVALLKLALAAQRAGRVEEARAKLGEHARRFPQGQLVSERKRIEARLPP